MLRKGTFIGENEFLTNDMPYTLLIVKRNLIEPIAFNVEAVKNTKCYSQLI